MIWHKDCVADWWFFRSGDVLKALWYIGNISPSSFEVVGFLHSSSKRLMESLSIQFKHTPYIFCLQLIPESYLKQYIFRWTVKQQISSVQNQPRSWFAQTSKTSCVQQPFCLRPALGKLEVTRASLCVTWEFCIWAHIALLVCTALCLICDILIKTQDILQPKFPQQKPFC